MPDIDQYTQLVTSEHNTRPKFMATIALLCQGSIDTQNVIATFPNLFDIDQAVGDQLDKIGVWVGVSRELVLPLSGVFFSFQENLIPDPVNLGGTWVSHGGPMVSTRTGSGWILNGNGGQQFSFWASQGFPIAPGDYYLSANFEASNVITGNPSVGIYDNTTGAPDFSTGGIAGLVQSPFSRGKLNQKVTIPPGVTNIVVIVDSFNAVVPVGKQLQINDVALQAAPSLGWGQGTWFSPFDVSGELTRLADDNYRVLLLSQVASNQWDGTIPGAYKILQLLYQLTGVQILIQDNQDMTISVIVLAPSVDAVFSALLHAGLLVMRPAGVGIAGYFKANVPVFGFGSNSDTIGGWGRGSWMKLSSF